MSSRKSADTRVDQKKDVSVEWSQSKSPLCVCFSIVTSSIIKCRFCSSSVNPQYISKKNILLNFLLFFFVCVCLCVCSCLESGAWKQNLHEANNFPFTSNPSLVWITACLTLFNCSSCLVSEGFITCCANPLKSDKIVAWISKTHRQNKSLHNHHIIWRYYIFSYYVLITNEC